MCLQSPNNSIFVNLWYSQSKSAMEYNKWDEDIFRDVDWHKFESRNMNTHTNTQHDEFRKNHDTMERLFFVFFGIVVVIIVCGFICMIFTICCRLIKGDRHQLYRRPFYNVPNGRPTHACNTHIYFKHQFSIQFSFPHKRIQFHCYTVVRSITYKRLLIYIIFYIA